MGSGQEHSQEGGKNSGSGNRKVILVECNAQTYLEM